MSFLPNFSKIVDVLLKIKLIEFNINSKNNFTVVNKPTYTQLNKGKSKMKTLPSNKKFN